MTTIRNSLLAGTIAVICVASNAWAAKIPDYITKAVADETRPQTDRDRDEKRKPAEVLAFAGVKPGDKVGEVMPGRGYFTQLFCRIVGEKGYVYTAGFMPAISMAGMGMPGGAPPAGAAPGGMPGGAPPAGMPAGAMPPGGMPAGGPAGGPPGGMGSAPKPCANLTATTSLAADMTFPSGLDLVWTSENYHDLYTKMGGMVDTRKFNKTIYDALKPGGIYVVQDYRAVAGSGSRDAETLHRIDPELVKQEVIAAGFKLIDSTDILRNPDDPLTVDARENPRTGTLRTNPAENLHGRTDHFMFKFQKPAK